ncbi:gliding motility-associated C-terminal domain-containing protein, partial [Crocinitomicaceae bacterium]|nr:gliding motility-associated C-terminal domain-containing protein [Crocinitomicaceae bacterium]
EAYTGCTGDGYSVVVNGTTYDEANPSGTENLTAVAGCDSIVTVDLVFNTVLTGTDVQSACDSYTWIDGNTYTASNNSATWVLPSVSGCDSTVTLDLTITNSNTGTDTKSACDTYTWIDGNTYTSSNNSATWVLTNIDGCDSLVTLDLIINTSPTLIDFTNGGIYCQGEVVNGLVAEVSGVPDFTLDYTLNGNPLSISSSSSSIDVGSSSGEYILNAITDNYCTTTLNQSQTIVINPIPDIPSLGDDAVYCSNAVPEAIQATGSTGSYNWYVDAALTELIVTADEYTPDMILGSYTYYVTASENGCEGLPAEVSITFKDCQIIIPTAFTPDDDQVNDFWELGNIDDIYPNNVVSVYNRWGNKVYESDQGAYNQRPWNGTFNEEALPAASYYFIIEFNDNSSQNKTGIVSIVK